MQRIIMLGTGHGLVYDLYNTCFVLQNDDQYLLVDTGGSSQIIKNLRAAKIDINQIHDIFISHCHSDHILGLFWIIKATMGRKDQLNIYCNEEVARSIQAIIPSIFSKRQIQLIDQYLSIYILDDNEEILIANQKMKFFDVHARGNQLYGFEMIFNNHKKLVFLGDETCHPSLYDRIKNADYVMHEAFCLDSEKDIFHPYEKNHSTVKSVCQSFQDLNIKNLILYHSEETHINHKKELYIQEGQKYFFNHIIVPDDLEIINLE